jgi:hypothetical protein
MHLDDKHYIYSSCKKSLSNQEEDYIHTQRVQCGAEKGAILRFFVLALSAFVFFALVLSALSRDWHSRVHKREKSAGGHLGT